MVFLLRPAPSLRTGARHHPFDLDQQPPQCLQAIAAQLPLPAGFQADQRAACHADRHEDEAFFVTAGHFTFHAGDRTFVVQASRFRSRPTTSHGTMVLDLDRRLGIEYPDLPE